MRVGVINAVIAGALSLALLAQLTFLVRRAQASTANGGLGSGLPRVAHTQPGAAATGQPPCDSWDCLKQQAGLIGQVVAGERPISTAVPVASPSRPPPASPPPTPSPQPLVAPNHCDETAGTGTHPGVDYFCCNRATGAAELSAVVSSSMTEYIATGGRFPILVITRDRAELLDSTLESLRGVRCVKPTDIYVVQDGTLGNVRAVIGEGGAAGQAAQLTSSCRCRA